jgi:hypothetical protein
MLSLRGGGANPARVLPTSIETAQIDPATNDWTMMLDRRDHRRDRNRG